VALAAEIYILQIVTIFFPNIVADSSTISLVIPYNFFKKVKVDLGAYYSRNLFFLLGHKRIESDPTNFSRSGSQNIYFGQ